MPTLDYRRKPPERRRLLTQAEFVIVSSGAVVLLGIIGGAIYLYFPALDSPQW